MVPVKLDLSLELILVAERLLDGLLRIRIGILAVQELAGASLNPRNCKIGKLIFDNFIVYLKVQGCAYNWRPGWSQLQLVLRKSITFFHTTL